MSVLPAPRGCVSHAIIASLADRDPGEFVLDDTPSHLDPFGGDLQLALYVRHELHYRGFDGVDSAWEWDPDLLRLRGALERRFLDRLHKECTGGRDATAVVDALCVEPIDGEGLSFYLRDHADWDQMCEFFAHRSLYHLKEADPHAWVIPRLQGKPKAALVGVEFDEFGGGRAERMHSTLFADLLDAAELDSSYLGYIDAVPPESLATVNFMSLCGLHRKLRGALVGLFAAAEITTAPSALRTAEALRRMDAPDPCIHFYTEHIEADAVHEQVLRHDVVGGLLEQEPALAHDVVFGVEASELLEQRFAEHLLGNWARGASSPLPGTQLRRQRFR